MLRHLKRFIPKFLLSAYHRSLALLASTVYRSPSEKLIVIGVTGTSGKSTVVYLVAKLLERAGFRVGAASTILFKVADREWQNDTKMTMPGRFSLQRLISQMVRVNCQYAIIETSSQGIEQFRHLGINYDVAVFTNLYPEHLEAHGGFEHYKAAKLKLFAKLKTDRPKLIANRRIPKVMIANADDEHSADVLQYPADEKFVFTATGAAAKDAQTVTAHDVVQSGAGMSFTIDSTPFHLKLLGSHNLSNALGAIAVGRSQGLTLTSIAALLAAVGGVPGRLEFIDEGQPFTIIVDYAFEPKAVESLYAVVKLLPHRQVIHVLGSAGGGRDRSRRPVLGELAGRNADYVIITNEDPYDDDPQQIINEVAAGALAAGKKLGKTAFKIMDRRKAIAKALRLAMPNDIVLITGKGSEQAIVVKNNKKVRWDDRQVVREELKKVVGNL
ncbi:MAG: hypothetical protein A2951_02880 [Candidatus Buchananbacteria bacterium RIFCSPLOWO2_01_FULL_56_15]|uniref:UDP-N-acetylmuramyl-tripeptide synthetase n=1 Tax=Candidatus Buchananbacteria bacterium RIFCSPLOWO2_01_FULL_56_15 TaxID=1797547 RepID=A0A1G1YTW6_9BACT|nr:MAG: hypothetical protein A2951_02880 [Candidatus Buchananbacteria bacterium RIFCSPLOWO2_01_FULL_56_15]